MGKLLTLYGQKMNSVVGHRCKVHLGLKFLKKNFYFLFKDLFLVKVGRSCGKGSSDSKCSK